MSDDNYHDLDQRLQTLELKAHYWDIASIVVAVAVGISLLGFFIEWGADVFFFLYVYFLG